MENNENITVSNNIETGKKKYSPSGTAIAEIICSAILVIALFLPWVRVEAAGESKEIALTEHGPLAFIYGGVFVFNIILKFFKRSCWLSALTAIVAVLMHTELGADHLNSTPNYYPVHYAPAIGEQIIFMVGLALMVIVCVSWAASLLKSIANYYRNKQHLMLYSTCLGLFFLLFFVVMLIGIVMVGSLDAFFEGGDTPFKMVVGGAFVIGITVFFFWAIVGSILWLFSSIRRKVKGEPVVDTPEDISQVPSYDSSASGQNEKPNKWKKLFILGICAVFVLFVGARIFNTYKGIQQESNESSPTQVEEKDVFEEKSETEEQDEPVVESQKYIPFEENGKTGVKDGTGKIIIPAEYEKLYIDENENGSILATESDTGNMMRYFKKTGQILKHIDFAGGTAVTLFHFADTGTHAFYTDEGQVMASGLSGDIFCLRQVDQSGFAVRTYFGFRNKDNNDDFMPVYDEFGKRVCTFTINGWQLFGIDHLTRIEDEPRDFEREFTFTIDLEEFITAHRSAVHQ
jgi:hypothetical protein